jgi:acyl transferase domain-containing protein
MTYPLHDAILVFPTGGYHWAGMGGDVAGTPRREVFDRAESAILDCDVAPGSLLRLMSGEDQARRVRTPEGWIWTGDFPLSMVAKLALDVALAEAWIERQGPPRALAGESMGELAAYAVAGALSLEDAARLSYRWARDLQCASDRLGLRMAIVEDLHATDVATLPPDLEANVVVEEAPGLCVVALPEQRLDDLDREVIRRRGRSLVSNNPCAAHEPRLAETGEVWSRHADFLASLTFSPARVPLLGTLDPGSWLDTHAALLRNRHETTFRCVRWDDTLRQLPDLGVRHVVVFGPPSAGYAFKRLRASVPDCAGLRLATVGTLEGAGAYIPRRFIA